MLGAKNAAEQQLGWARDWRVGVAGRTMRLAVLNLTASGMSGGYRSYLRNMIPRLAADSRVESLLCCSLASLRAQVWIPQNKKIQFGACAPFGPLSRRLDRELEQMLSVFRPDVIFVPTARAVRYRDVPVVTMIQNMAPLRSWRPYGLAEWPRLAVQRMEAFRAVRQAAGVIAVSEFVRQFLIEECAIADEKVAPIYFGSPSPEGDPVRPGRLPLDWNEFVFTAGSLEPYRSLEDLIGAAEHARKRLGRPIRVVIAGSARESMQPYEQRLKTIARKAGIFSDLCWLGQLSRAEMTWCYKNCAAFVMTSRIEACPNTVLEAMALGSVCISADNPPLPEFFSKAALYYVPGDKSALAARISDVYSWDSAKRAEASAAACERSRIFNWDAASEKTLGLFQRVFESR